MIAQTLIDLNTLTSFVRDHPAEALILVAIILALCLWAGIRYGTIREQNRAKEVTAKTELKAQENKNQANVLTGLTTAIGNLVQITTEAQAETRLAREAQIETTKQQKDLIEALNKSNALEDKRIDMRAKALSDETASLNRNSEALAALSTGITASMALLTERISSVDTATAERTAAAVASLRKDLESLKADITEKINTLADSDKQQFVSLNQQVGTVYDLAQTLDGKMASVVEQMKAIAAKLDTPKAEPLATPKPDEPKADAPSEVKP